MTATCTSNATLSFLCISSSPGFTSTKRTYRFSSLWVEETKANGIRENFWALMPRKLQSHDQSSGDLAVVFGTSYVPTGQAASSLSRYPIHVGTLCGLHPPPALSLFFFLSSSCFMIFPQPYFLPSVLRYPLLPQPRWLKAWLQVLGP